MSRKFLTPIVLPADPVVALEAATKQYVDGKVVGGGTSEVEIAAADPIGTNAAAELWYDTAAATPAGPMASQVSFAPVGNIPDTNVQAAIARLPRGLIASTYNNTQTSCPANTLTYLTTALPVTMLTGRKYRLGWSFRACGRQDNSATQLSTNLTLYDGATVFPGGVVDHWFILSLMWSTLTGFVYLNGDGVARSLRIAIGSAAAPAAALYIYPTWFGIEDVGAV